MGGVTDVKFSTTLTKGSRVRIPIVFLAFLYCDFVCSFGLYYRYNPRQIKSNGVTDVKSSTALTEGTWVRIPKIYFVFLCCVFLRM